MTSGTFRVVPRAARPPSLLLLVSFVTLLSGCGGGPTDPPVVRVSPTPPPPVTQVIREGSGSLGVLVLGQLSFNTTKPGTIDVIVDWTYATNDVDVYLAKGSCSFDQFISRQCDMVAFSERNVLLSETMTFSLILEKSPPPSKKMSPAAKSRILR